MRHAERDDYFASPTAMRVLNHPAIRLYRLSPAVLSMAMCPLLWASLAIGGEPQPPDFDRMVAPLIARRCLECHNSVDLKGKLEVSVIVKPTGDVEKTSIISKKFAGQPLAECIAGAVMRWRFPPFQGADSEVILPFILDAFF